MVGRAAALLTPRFVAGLALFGALLAYYAFFRELPNLPTTADVLFVATVALQLVADGRVSLSDSVEHWLPGILRYGDQVSAAGPVQTGSYGQSQIHALEFSARSGPG